MEKEKEIKSGNYIVYENDLKYKSLRELDPKCITWDSESVEKQFYEENLDTLNYRINECIKNNYLFLDLKHLELSKLPTLSNDIYSRIKHLFLADNNLTIIPDLDIFTALETLELSHNKITKINKLPKTLVELTCKHNKLTSLNISGKLRRLKKLDCSHNELVSLNDSNLSTLEILICEHTKLTGLPYLENIKKIICNNNKITDIKSYPNLLYIDCKYNNIRSIESCNKLIDLICSYNNDLTILPNLINIKYIEIINTDITTIEYYDTLYELFCGITQIKNISNKYKVSSAQTHKNKLLLLKFISKDSIDKTKELIKDKPKIKTKDI
jgi:hypothetical protein